ncbi:MAG: site-2 protease family protein [Acidimicrobiia bacterium]|nr:site-2 protease family protein [Acidimicrobiia bacterium]
MSEQVRVGRIFGIEVGFNWSLLVIFWLVAWTLAAGYLPQAAPGYTTVEYWVAGAAGAFLFFTSLLAHEMAHSLVARRHGVEVEGITLWLFGGIARLAGEPPAPSDELRISAVGPATSLVLGLGFGALSFVLAPWPAAAGAAWWLAFVNVALAVFNLLPAAPLDGGRVLHSILWHRHGDRLRATVSMCRSGRVAGWILVGSGLLEFAAGVYVGGIWFVFLGWFLHQAAASEEAASRLRASLSGHTVADIMTPGPDTGPGWVSVASFVDDTVMPRRHSTYPLRDRSGAIVGFVTLARLEAVPVRARHDTAVRDVGVPLEEAVVVGPAEPAEDAIARLSDHGDGRLLVMDGADLVGIVTPSDVARWMQMSALRPHGPASNPPAPAR